MKEQFAGVPEDLVIEKMKELGNVILFAHLADPKYLNIEPDPFNRWVFKVEMSTADQCGNVIDFDHITKCCEQFGFHRANDLETEGHKSELKTMMFRFIDAKENAGTIYRNQNNNQKESQMKNQVKKSKRVHVENVGDLLDELVKLEHAANMKIAASGVDAHLGVEQGVGLINIKTNDEVTFSMNVSDANASYAFGALKCALDRAMKSLIKVPDNHVTVPENADIARVETNGTGIEKLKSQLDAVVDNANIRLVEIRNGGKIDDVAVCYVLDGSHVVVKAGDIEIARESLGDKSAFYHCRSAIWRSVDAAKPGRAKRTAVVEKQIARASGSTSMDFSARLDAVIESANEKLRELGELAMHVESDSVGVYVKSGNLPVYSLPKGVGNAGDALEKVSKEVWAFVDATRGVVDRRKHNLQRSQELETDSGWDMAMIERANPSIDKSEPWKLGPNPDAAAAIVEAAKKAVKSFNASLRFKFDDAVSEMIGPDEMKLSVKGFTRGIVVAYGNTPCLVTTFPLVANNATTEETAVYVNTTIAAIGESRMKFYTRIATEHARQERLRELAAKKDALVSEIEAMAM